MTNPTAQSPPTPAVSSGVYYSHGNGSTQQEIKGMKFLHLSDPVMKDDVWVDWFSPKEIRVEKSILSQNGNE